MAVSSYRLIIMVIIIDILVMVLIPGFNYATNVELDQQYLEDRITGYENWTDSYYAGMNAETENENKLIMNQQFGDAKSAGKDIWEIFSMGLINSKVRKDMESCLGDDCSLPYVYWLVFAIWSFLGIANLLAGVELYFIIFNKKYS